MKALLLYSALIVLLLMPHRSARAECKEFKIVEYDDRVEVVCIGEPPTAAEIKAAQAEKSRQEQENQRQKANEINLQKEEAAKLKKAKADEDAAAAKAAAERKKQNPPSTVPKQIKDKNLIDIKNL